VSSFSSPLTSEASAFGSRLLHERSHLLLGDRIRLGPDDLVQVAPAQK
jgi:hypothetical protein